MKIKQQTTFSCAAYVVVCVSAVMMFPTTSLAAESGFGPFIPDKDPTDNLVAGEQHVLINADSDKDSDGDDDSGGNVYIGRQDRTYVFIGSDNKVDIWNLEAENAAGFKSSIDVDGTSNFDGAATFKSSVDVDGSANFDGSATFNSDVQVKGTTSLADTKVSGTVEINTGASDISNTVTIGNSAGGSTSINSKIITLGDTETVGREVTVAAKGGALSINDDGLALSGTSEKAAGTTISGYGGSLTYDVGVEIHGDGNVSNDGAVVDGVAQWADVLIRSKSYDPTNLLDGSSNGLGSAIIVNDYGVNIVSPTLTGGAGNSYSSNSFGSGKNNSAGTQVTNLIGEGGDGQVNNEIGNSSGAGETNNTIGQNSGSGTIQNVIGLNTGDGTVDNTFGANTGSGDVTNNFGSNNGSGTTENNFGGGSSPTSNNIGNTNDGTTVTLTASGAATTMANGVSTTQVEGGDGTGGSILPNARPEGTSGDSGIVLKGAKGARHATVDSNGKIEVVSGDVQQTTASMVVTNGYGNSHGFIVNETQATMSGGTSSSSLTLNDGGATFSNSSSGGPIQVHGVDDGTAPFDAVNVRQLEAGLAQSVALSGIPAIRPGDNNAVGIAFGVHGEGYAIALGGQHYIKESLIVKYGAATDLNDAKVSYSAHAGVGFSW